MGSYWFTVPARESELKRIFVGMHFDLKRHKHHWAISHCSDKRSLIVARFYWGDGHEHETNEEAFAAANRECERLRKVGFGRVL